MPDRHSGRIVRRGRRHGHCACSLRAFPNPGCAGRAANAALRRHVASHHHSTSFRSFRTHRSKGRCRSSVLKLWAAPIVFGVLAVVPLRGSATRGLQVRLHCGCRFFFFLAIRLLFGRENWRLGLELPASLPCAFMELLFGLLSSLMGIGGGQLSTLMLTFYSRPIHQAVATSSGVGLSFQFRGAGLYLRGLGSFACAKPGYCRTAISSCCRLCIFAGSRAVHSHQRAVRVLWCKSCASPVTPKARTGLRGVPAADLHQVPVVSLRLTSLSRRVEFHWRFRPRLGQEEEKSLRYLWILSSSQSGCVLVTLSALERSRSG